VSASISIADSSADEDAGSMHFTLVLSSPQSQSVTIDYATEEIDGEATSGTDYTSVSSTASFTAGQSTTTASVEIIDDFLAEDDEEFRIRLSNASPGTVSLPDPTAIGTIYDSGKTIDIDIDIDSNNDRIIDPDDTGSGTDDPIENDSNKPGKFIQFDDPLDPNDRAQVNLYALPSTAISSQSSDWTLSSTLIHPTRTGPPGHSTTTLQPCGSKQ